jgi:hypothetical protein
MKRILGAAIAIMLLFGALLFSTFRSLSVCRQCGSKRSTIEFQVPLSSLTYWSRHNVEETEMSRTARDARLVGDHVHDWVFVHGSGNGIACALGEGGDASTNVRLPEVVSFISCSGRYRERREAAEWLSMALDPVNSRAVCQWLTVEQFPENGFETAADYENWRSRADGSWSEILAQHQEQR